MPEQRKKGGLTGGILLHPRQQGTRLLDDFALLLGPQRAPGGPAEAHHLVQNAIAFDGEGHGFRKEENIVRSVEATLSFVGQVFGFEPADDVEPVALR